MKKCEYCGEEIHINSKRCSFCGSIVKGTPQKEEVEIPPILLEAVDGSNEGIGASDLKKETAETEAVNYSNNRQNNFKGLQNTQPLSNALKVFLSTISVIPGIGQIIGIIAAILYMSSDEQDIDRKSFGKALLIACLVLFVIWGMCCIAVGVIGISEMMTRPNGFND